MESKFEKYLVTGWCLLGMLLLLLVLFYLVGCTTPKGAHFNRPKASRCQHPASWRPGCDEYLRSIGL
jgi:hypothetical protein